MTNQLLVRGMVLLFGTLYGGLRAGYKLDEELQAAESRITLVEVPEDWRPFFHFRWRPGHMVARCALWVEIIGYITTAIIIVGMMIGGIFPKTATVIRFAIEIIFVVFIVAIVAIGLPSTEQEKSFQEENYDLDWVVNIQQDFGVLKHRRCWVVQEVSPGIYKIRCGIIIRCYHLATTTIPVEIGKKYYAVHFYDYKPVYWQIRDH